MGPLGKFRTACLERTAAGLDWVARWRGRSPLAAHLQAGTQGEEAALYYLGRKGYTIVARRWCSGDRPGDVDLIAWNGQVLCFVEVKTRTQRDRTPAEAAVDRQKRHTLRRLAAEYLRQLREEEPPAVRFDVISVYMEAGRRKEFVHFENAFGWEERKGRD